MGTLNFFNAEGARIKIHRDELIRAGSDFSAEITAADAAGGSVVVTFWSKSGGSWTAEAANTFAAPAASWDATTRIASFWIGPGASGPGAAGTWGAKVVVTLTDGSIHVSDHPITLFGAMST